MAASLASGTAGQARGPKPDPDRHISPAVAHEMNNIITIIQGYTDRLLLKHGDNPAIESNLKMIAEAARRAATLVRNSVTPPANLLPRPKPDSTPPTPPA
jgi:hypothetical protein